MLSVSALHPSIRIQREPMKILYRAQLRDQSTGHIIASSVARLEADEVVRAWEQWQQEIMAATEMEIRLSAEHLFWSWSRKTELVVRNPSRYWIIGVFDSCSPEMIQGMCFITVRRVRSPISRKSIVYVNYLATAPWNDTAYTRQPR